MLPFSELVIVMESFISFMRYWWPGANMSIITDTPAEISSKESTQIRILRQLVQEGSIKLVGSKGRRAELPFAVVGLLDEILKNMQAGKAVSIVPEHQQLTTQRAANLLGVSRPFLVRLLEEGHLPFHMVGSHRRVYLKDLLAYQQLTTQRAANLLGVSRPFLVRLLEEGHLPFHMVGSHRRVYLKDLLAYRSEEHTSELQSLRHL